MTTSATPGTSRRPGRPRDGDVDARALRATLELLTEAPSGDAVTIGAVVERSGVSRGALYRRWRTREELLAAALDSVRTDLVTPRTGSLLTDLLALYVAGADVPAQVQVLVRRRVALALEDPRFGQVYWEQHVSRRRAVTLGLLRDAADAGLLRPGTDLEATVDLVAGVLYYHLLVRGDAQGDDARHRITNAITLVWRGIAAEPD